MRQAQATLPGSSTQNKRSSKNKRGLGASLPMVGRLLKALGGGPSKGTSAKRGRRPALLGLAGAGAAGATVMAKRRKGRRTKPHQAPAIPKAPGVADEPAAPPPSSQPPS